LQCGRSKRFFNANSRSSGIFLLIVSVPKTLVIKTRAGLSSPQAKKQIIMFQNFILKRLFHYSQRKSFLEQ